MNLSILLVFIIPTLVASAESTDSNTAKQQLHKRTDAWTTYFEDEIYEKPVTEERELHGDRYHVFRGYHSSSKSGKSGRSSRSSYSCSSSSSSGKSGKSCSSSSTRSTSSKSGKSGSSSRRLDKRLVNLRASLRSEDLSADEEERELHINGCGRACLYNYKRMFGGHHRGYHSSSSSKSGKSGSSSSRSYSCSSSSSSSGKSGKSCNSSSSTSTRSSSKSGKSGSSSRSYSTSKSGKSGSSSHRA